MLTNSFSIHLLKGFRYVNIFLIKVNKFLDSCVNFIYYNIYIKSSLSFKYLRIFIKSVNVSGGDL